MTRRHFRPIQVEDIPPGVAKNILAMFELFPDSDGLINGVEWFADGDWTPMYLRTREWRWFVADPIGTKPMETVHDLLKKGRKQ